jgi:hypothetical protein
MKKQTILINNNGNQDSIVDIILQLAELGFDVSCAMTELSSCLKAEREFADSEESADTLH